MLKALAPELSDGSLSYLYLPVDRDGAGGPGVVSYRVWDPTGAGYPAFAPVTGTLVFAPGQATAEIAVPTNVGGAAILPGLALGRALCRVSIRRGRPLGGEGLDQGPNDPLYVRTPANPLGLPTTPPGANPLGGGRFFADYFQSLPGRTALAWSASYPSLGANVEVIAREPNTQRFGVWNGLDPASAASAYLDRAASNEPGTVPMLST